MTKGLKVFNVILMIVLVIVAISALVSTAYWAIDTFKITALDSVKTFISDNLWFMVSATGLYTVNIFLTVQITALASANLYILLGFNLLLLIWSIVLLVKITKPEDHFCKFKPWTFVINLFFALFALINLHWAFDGILAKLTLQSGLIFIITLLIVAMFVIHLNMNLCGRASMKEASHAPKDIFPANNTGFSGSPIQQQTFGQPQGFAHPQNPQPPHRMPPPPPPPQA